jgi:hypothetical protein
MNMQFCPPPGFAPPYGFPQGQGASMGYAEPQYPLHAAYPGLQYMYGYQAHRQPMMTDRGSLCDGKTESKPRLSKEEVQKLEKVFQENPKPSSSVKAQLADGLGLERPRINVGCPPPVSVGCKLTRGIRIGSRIGAPRRSKSGNKKSTRLGDWLRSQLRSPHLQMTTHIPGL